MQLLNANDAKGGSIIKMHIYCIFEGGVLDYKGSGYLWRTAKALSIKLFITRTLQCIYSSYQTTEPGRSATVTQKTTPSCTRMPVWGKKAVDDFLHPSVLLDPFQKVLHEAGGLRLYPPRLFIISMKAVKAIESQSASSARRPAKSTRRDNDYNFRLMKQLLL